MDRASWSDPPEFLMIEIVKRIDSRFDILRIRAVCTLWRSSVPSPFSTKTAPFLAKLPWPIPCEDSDNPKLDGRYYVLKETIICRLEKIADTVNSPGWLVMIEDGISSIISSPKLSMLPCPKVLNLMDFRIMEIFKANELQFVDSNSFPVTSLAKHDSLDVIKVVLSSLDFAIFVLQDYGKLDFLRLGDEKWTSANAVIGDCEDIVSYKGKIYAVDYEGKVVVFDSSWRLTEITCHVLYAGGHRLHLVESFGDLLLVQKCIESCYPYTQLDKASSVIMVKMAIF